MRIIARCSVPETVVTMLPAENENRYLHPELSLLEFNQRVLHMALDPDIPLLERLRFLCIFSSNMDEFFEIRVLRELL